MELHAPDVIVRNEKRMYRKRWTRSSTTAAAGRVLRGTNNRPLKSLSDTLEGQAGPFPPEPAPASVLTTPAGRFCSSSARSSSCTSAALRRKWRSSSSNRSFITGSKPRATARPSSRPRKYGRAAGPDSCGTFEEVDSRASGVAQPRSDASPPRHPGIRAVLVKAKPFESPAWCTAFNADLTGDQMAVHIPLSRKRRSKLPVLMLSSRKHPFRRRTACRWLSRRRT